MQIRLSRGLKFIIAIIILVVLMYMQNISLASSTIYAGVAKLRETGVGYRIGEKDIWKLISYTDTSGSNYLDDALYCVKAGVGFTYTGSGNVRTYDASYNLKTEKNKIAELSTADYSSIATNPHYNNILWILDNIYIPNESTAEDRAALLSAAGIDTDYNPGFALFPLTDDEIEVVQQMAIWYYTNYDDPDYHKTPEQFYNQLRFTTNGAEYKNLSTYNQNSTGEGPIKAEQMRLLYEHFINTSEANASIYDGTTNEIAPVEVITDNINITKSGTDYLAGPINIKKNNDNLYNINIQVTDENNVDITSKISFVDRSGRPVTNFVGNEFYVKVPANLTSRVNVDIQIAYNSTTSTLWVSNTSFVEQPLVKIEKTENNIITKLSVEIPEETEVSVEKVWEDNNNQDGVRPGSVEVQLYKNGTSMGTEYKATLSENTWSHTWESLPKKENGVDIEYSVKELTSTGEAVEEGTAYDANYIATYEIASNTTTITNTHIPETTKVSVEKVWEDANNQDGVRPGSVEVQLYKNGASMGDEYKATLQGESWRHTWENLAKKENGVDIEYSVKELTSTGAAVENNTAYDTNYTATYEIASNTTTITNTHIPEITKVSVEKVWEDVDNQDGVRPGSIEVQLYKNGTSMGDEYKATLSENTWSHTWESLPKKENGVDIEYSVKELNSTGEVVEEGTAYDANYTATYEVAGNTTTITNTHISETTKVSVEKVWEDVDNQDGVRPGSIEVQLYKNGTSMGAEYKATLQGESWSYAWENLPKKENGVDIQYSVKELKATGEEVENNTAYDENYTVKYEISGEKTTITNTHIPEITKVEVEKVWEDGNNQDGVRPGSIEVQLYKNGTSMGADYKATLSESTWSHTWENLPKKENGVDIQYSVKELNKEGEAVEEGTAYDENYTAKYEVSGEKTTITNTHIPETTKVEVEKVWEDGNNQDGVRPGSIEVQLYKNGTSMGADYKATLSESTWSHTWENLPKKENGVDIQYSVKELNKEGEAVEEGTAYDENYTAKYEVSGEKTTITNTHIPETTKVEVEKIWEDNNNQDGVRPGSIEVQLYKNGTSMGDEYKATLQGESWSHAWENLPKKENGVDIKYSVKELNSTGAAVENNTAYDANYIATYEVAGNTTTITNTHMPETTKVSVEKVWNDEGNQDGVRPGSIEVQLNKNGTSMGADYKATLSESTWSHTWENLPKKENGVDIQYSVKELKATGEEVENNTAYDENYTVKYEISGEKTTITNTHIPEITKVEVEKVWEDGNNQDGVRPGSIEVQLYKNGTSMGEEYKATLSENTWSHTWESLPKKENGVDIQYSVKELNKEGEAVEEGTAYDENYTATYEVSGEKTTITNTHIPEEKEFDLSLRKFISAVDGVSPEVSREPQVDITYLADGTATTAIYNHTKEPIKVTKESTIVYTIRVYNEGEVDGYASEVVDHLPEWLELVQGSEINTQYGWQVGEDGRTITTRYLENELIKAFDGEKLDYKDIQIECKIKDTAIENTNITNIAEITEYQDENHEEVQPDRDSESDSLTDDNEIKDDLPEDEDLPGYKDEEADEPYVPGQEDDDDFEKVYIEPEKEFDLSLRKFITEVDGIAPEPSREPQVEITHLADGTATTAIYNHTKEPIKVTKESTIIYTIRVYNEGEVDGYASEVVDHLPEWLELVQGSEINTQYGWQVGEDGRTITTRYLENELIKAFDGEKLDYKDIQIECQIKETAVAETNMTNIAEITKYENENHEEVQPDRDSTSDSLTDEETPDQLPSDEELPNYKDEETDKPYVPGQEDDDDFEKIYIEEPKEPETPPEEPETPPEEPEIFDLSLLKYVTQVIVTEDGVQKVTETGNVGDENDIIPKVEIHKKKLSTTEVKFAYTIKITNEGDIPGYAKEISDDIPEGLEFVPEDNPQWILGEDGWIHTRALENTLLQPGESTTVKVIFKWINSGNNLGIKTNTAEITEDYNDKDVPDIDSTPGNKAPGEDDIDIAEVLLSISTGRVQTYFVLGTAVLITLASGIAIIRKFVI